MPTRLEVIAVLETVAGLRVLGPGDLPELTALLHLDPVHNVFVAHRVETTGLQPRWLGGQVWGYHEGGRLVSACHAAANLVPVGASPEALEAFAERAAVLGRTSSSIVGFSDQVRWLWNRLAPTWGPARSLRMDQPYLAIDRPPPIPGDPRVRRVLVDELDVVYPASVAMFTEEVGQSPEVPHRHAYRARVAHLIARGWAFAIIEDGRVVFKAELGAVSARSCQVQGVYVDPALRGRGIAGPAMASVVRFALAEVAPVVTLYVNGHNVAARRAYERAGFVQTSTFASVLF